MRIMILYYKDAEDDLDTEATKPDYWEGAETIVQAEEALGRLEGFIKRKKSEEPLPDEEE